MSQFQTAHAYLDDNIKSIGDLKISNIRSLLAAKQKEQENLEEEFEGVKSSTRAVLEDIFNRATAQKAALDKLHSSLVETEKNLAECSAKCASNNSSTFQPSSFVEDIDSLRKELTSVQNAETYVKTLLAASDLRAQAKRLVTENTEDAIKPYNQLVELTLQVKKKIQSEDQCKHLVSHLEGIASTLYQELLDILTRNFSKTLDDLSWPTPLRPPYKLEVKEKLGGFQQACRHLLLLKAPHQFKTKDADGTGPTDLIPITIMNKALSLRFRYHFETSKPTNRPDKPEWFLSHVKNTIGAHLPFLITTVQPIVTDTLQQTISVKDVFINGLMEDILRKLRHHVPRILNKPSYLSHTIHEVLEFEKMLLEDFSYQPLPANSPGSLILDNTDWFDAWFDTEKEFAEKRYIELITDAKAFDAYEEQTLNNNHNGNEVQASRSASRLLGLLESVTESYKLLPKIQQKLRFLLDIQFDLLGQYHGRISAALDSFEALNLIRSVPAPGGLPDAVTGLMTTANSGGTLAALHRLYRWWASSRTVCDTLKEIGDEDFFLDMQYQIRQDDESISRITSEQTPFSSYAKDTSDESIFSCAVTAFKMLEQKVDRIAIKIIMKEWASDARLYVRRWQMPPDDTSSLDNISAELYQPLQNFKSSCEFLSTQMPSADFVNILRELYTGIEDWHMRNIIAPNRLSEDATQQLRKDLELGLWKVGRRWISKPENFTRRLKAQVSLKEDEDSLR